MPAGRLLSLLVDLRAEAIDPVVVVEDHHGATRGAASGSGEALLSVIDEYYLSPCQGCHVTQLGGELGMFIAGGFQRSGRRVRWLPLGRPGKPMVEELQMLVEPRRSQYTVDINS